MKDETSFQHPQGESQSSITAVPDELTPSSGLQGCAHGTYRYMHSNTLKKILGPKISSVTRLRIPVLKIAANASRKIGSYCLIVVCGDKGQNHATGGAHPKSSLNRSPETSVKYIRHLFLV